MHSPCDTLLLLRLVSRNGALLGLLYLLSLRYLFIHYMPTISQSSRSPYYSEVQFSSSPRSRSVRHTNVAFVVLHAGRADWSFTRRVIRTGRSYAPTFVVYTLRPSRLYAVRCTLLTGTSHSLAYELPATPRTAYDLLVACTTMITVSLRISYDGACIPCDDCMRRVRTTHYV